MCGAAFVLEESGANAQMVETPLKAAVTSVFFLALIVCSLALFPRLGRDFFPAVKDFAFQTLKEIG